ncbi:MAG: hypothetical protein ACYDEA_06780 [Candidatus Dormibacteria bacterium]
MATAEWQAAAERSTEGRRRARRRITPWAAGLTATVAAAGAVGWVVHVAAATGTGSGSQSRLSQALHQDETRLAVMERETVAEQRRLATLGTAHALVLPALPAPPAHAATGASGVP